MAEKQTLQYQAIPVRMEHGEDGNYGTYGLAVTKDGERYIVKDVTTDRREAEQLAELFTRVQLSPLHLLDALEDML